MSTPPNTQNKTQAAMARVLRTNLPKQPDACFDVRNSQLELHPQSASSIAGLQPLFDSHRKALFHFSLSLKELSNQEGP
ncbi:hypothetical protein N7530_007372 [Penicillium desertorum]|uniref:Uncharacterized protein n=1 Tax=Penicillium desertorum TaxID=1303715 RepID=A0A9X0BJV8_9EURO|nr:hypothetical protein N7530_007372 [Penicillium desertorum]